MAKRLFVYETKSDAIPKVGSYIIDWCVENEGCGLGGATGRSPIDVWKWIWDELESGRRHDREALVGQDVVFLDEYLGAFPAYFHWAWRHLRIGQAGIGFSADKVFVPRGCFFEPYQNRIISSSRLEEILSEWTECWDGFTEPGEGNKLPEIRIKENPVDADAIHPVLAKIRETLKDYDSIVHTHSKRLQLLGLGIGGSIQHDKEAGGHIGFVESGAAARDTQTMLVRLARSTISANEPDFLLRNEDGDVSLEPSHFAVTQGISSILDFTGELLLMAWGQSKQLALHRMFLGTPGPKNPAAWLQNHKHDNVTVFVDRAALGELDQRILEERGWSVEFSTAATVVNTA